MSGMMLQLEYALGGAELMLVLLGLAVAVLMPAVDRWSKRFFVSFFLLLVAYALLALADAFFFADRSMETLQMILYYFETLLPMALLLMITVYLHHCCGETWRRSLLLRLVAVPLGIGLIGLHLTLVTDWVYTLAPGNQVIRGPLYVPLVADLVLIPVLNLVFAYRWRGRMSRRSFYAFVLGQLPMIIAMTVHFFVSVFALLGLGLAICALSMFGIILFDQIDQMMLQQREIAHQRASIMVLQMRPHFIYNTMMSIYYLCKQNPDLAQQVTLDFTTYLRKNFTAIASEEPIPVSEELEHTRAYLAVEQAQFENQLLIEFDTPQVDFRVPPLTLQPIVENAVKHGMDPDSEPLRIRIRTAATDTGYEITVEDTGLGFGTPDESEPHIALKNIRQRLEMMCGGTLTIMPRREGGTVVRVTIPRQSRFAIPGAYTPPPAGTR